MGKISKVSLKYQQNPIELKEKVENKKEVVTLGRRSRRPNKLRKLEAPILIH